MQWEQPKEWSSWRWKMSPSFTNLLLLLLPSFHLSTMLLRPANTLFQPCMVPLSTSTVQTPLDPPEGPSGSCPPGLFWSINTGNSFNDTLNDLKLVKQLHLPSAQRGQLKFSKMGLWGSFSLRSWMLETICASFHGPTGRTWSSSRYKHDK